MKKRRFEFFRYAPAGMDLRQEKGFFIGGLCGAQIFSLMSFFPRFMGTYERIWMDQKAKVPYPGTQVAAFGVFLDNSLLGFLILAVGMLGFVAYHYLYHQQGSKSIYLMRRLPDAWELHRRCWTLPTLAIAVILGVALLNFVCYLLLYVNLIPEVCRPQGLW